MTIEQALQTALGHHQAGRLAEAETLYRQVLARAPDHADALHLLGVLACQAGHWDAAIDLIGRAVARQPMVAAYHSNLGETYRKAGRLDEAAAAFHRALELAPNLAPAHNSLGIVLKDLGQPAEALASYRRALALEPNYAEALTNLAAALREQGEREPALAALDRAVAVRPELAEAHYNRGATLHDLSRLEAAAEAYCKTLALRPEMIEAEANLANVYQELGRPGEALAHMERALALGGGCAALHNNRGLALKDLGRPDLAIAAYGQALALDPALPEAHNGLGNALDDLGRHEEALAAFDRALALRPSYPEALNNRGLALKELGRLDEALAAFDAAIALRPGLAEAHNNQGNVLMEQGRLDEALAAFRAAVAVRPDLQAAESNALFLLHYLPEYDGQAILAEHRRWAARCAAPLAAEIRPHPNDRDPDRRLRIGFISPDFRGHPTGLSYVCLLPHLDRGRTEVVVFSDVRCRDGVTAQLEALADEWHNTVGQSDQALAEQIRAAGIDILVDPTVHGAGSRARVFARKPAPVQATLLGPPTGSGLETIDYRFTDPVLDPPGASDGDYTERSLRLPHCFWIYQPPEEAPEPGPLPATTNGYVTFGFLNQFAKVSPPARRLWIRVLQALPGSRLIVHAGLGRHRDALRAEFAASGIAGDRIEFLARAPRAEYFRRYQNLDIGLDPFPYNGHTATKDALWMGVPVVALAGRTAVGRGGASILTTTGLPELIARTPDEYVAIAVNLARDLDKLAALRAELRQRLLASPLLDRPEFAAAVDAAFRRMWHEWCRSPREGEAPSEPLRERTSLLQRGVALHQTGRLEEAIAAYRRASAVAPDQADPQTNLAVALHQAGRTDEAIAAAARATVLQPTSAVAQYNLGNLLAQVGRLDEAATALRRAIALEPGFAEAHCNLGNILKDQAYLDEALACWRLALELKPGLIEAASSLLVNIHYHPGFDARMILAEHRRWAARYAEPLAREIRSHRNDRMSDRKLRVGFLSPDFRDHPVGRSLQPLFAHHDRGQTEFVVYSDVVREDDVTRGLRGLACAWHDVAGQDDARVAARVRDDRIDILVDPSLHTAGNRLLVFARKPAPIQLTMLGPPTTSGLTTIDYRFTDRYLDPPGESDGDYTERSVRLPHCFWLYSPPDDAPEVNALPARTSGRITFGCLNQFFKISRPAWTLWREILRAVPDSRLIALSHPGSHLEPVRALFRDDGIDPDRLEFVAPADRTTYFGRYLHVDLGLDPFPYNGHTSTLDALWMGVPVVTLAGRTAVGRGGVTLLSNLGLPELIARTPERCVEIAVELARDVDRLAELRSGLRERLRMSPLMDGKQFAADLETALRRMWHQWCRTVREDEAHAEPGRDAASLLLEGVALQQAGRLYEAIAVYQRAVARAPDDACVHNNIGSALREQGRLDEAVATLRRAIELNPALAPAHANLGVALADQGRVSGAIASLRRSIALEPYFARAHSSLVYTLMFCPGQDTRTVYEESRRWNERHAAPLSARSRPHLNDRTPDRRVRIGYVSPDFREHSQSLFTVPLFAAHDHERFTIHAYADVAVPDQVTARLKFCTDVWRDIRGLSPEQVADIVRQDRIDILVDLTMHMTGEHLEVFARKPAPVQACWLAYPGTTGLSAIDYRLTDRYLDPPGEDESLFSEQTLRLPRCFWCYDPLTNEPQVNPLPALKRGTITFGSLNNFWKVNEDVLRLWARVLGAVSGSRLVLLAREGSHRDDTRVFLEREGIAPDRVTFAAPVPRPRYLELYHQIDLALDPFPYPGHTTTFDALWMGVPVVTLAGGTPVGRGGVSILSNLGLPELIAQTPEQYLRIAADLAADRPRLAELRAGLRPRMQSSALMDGKQFAADFETALRRMWQTWCNNK
jgi:predicted O-linked N-acetylglucosamine transferase (SPINDLY family)